MAELYKVAPLEQDRPGDVLEPVARWVQQFEGRGLILGELVESGDVEAGTNEIRIPHSLGRVPTGAFFVGWLGPIGVDRGPACDLSQSTAEYVFVFRSSGMNQAFRYLVF